MATVYFILLFIYILWSCFHIHIAKTDMRKYIFTAVDSVILTIYCLVFLFEYHNFIAVMLSYGFIFSGKHAIYAIIGTLKNDEKAIEMYAGFGSQVVGIIGIAGFGVVTALMLLIFGVDFYVKD